jgi:archaemetzincin
VRPIVIVSDQGVEEIALQSIEMGLVAQLELEPRRQGMFPVVATAFLATRSQYDSAWILESLARDTAEETLTLGVTNRDLCLPMLSFVFGHAQLRGRVALMSLARLRQEFYSLAPDPMLLEARAAKEALHEVGHALGLVHCPRRSCVMSLATDVEQVDAKQAAFCRTCRALLRELETGDAGDENADPGRKVQK